MNNLELTTSHLFAGAGGDTQGAIMAGYKPIWAVENDQYASAIYRQRFSETILIQHDIQQLSDTSIKSLVVPDILIGGSPCQGFSNGGLRMGLQDERSSLFYEYLRFLTIQRPSFFIWENVGNVQTINKGKDFKFICDSFTELGYGTDWGIKNASKYVPQSRKRMYVLGMHERLLEYSGILKTIATSDSDIDFKRLTLAECLDHIPNTTEKIGIVIKHGRNDVRLYFDLAPTIRSLTKNPKTGKQSGSGSIKVRQYFKTGGHIERSIRPNELEKIMGWTVGSTEKGITINGQMIDISPTQRHKALGNGIVPHAITEILLKIKPAIIQSKNDK
jgi:DNA-cytosine methyltransferase